MTRATNDMTAGGSRQMSDQPVAVGPDAPIFEVMRSARAMRRLKPDPVPAELLERIVEAATWAPSGANGQAWSFIVVTDRDQIRRLAPLFRQINDFYFNSPLAGHRTPKELEAIRYQYEHFEETPAIIVACYDKSRVRPFRNRRESIRRWRDIIRAFRTLSWREGIAIVRHARRGAALSAAASIYTAVENLLLAARSLGLGATLTTGYLYIEPEFKRVLGIPKSVNTYALIPIGYPLGRFGPVRRRPVAEAIHVDRWQGGAAHQA